MSTITCLPSNLNQEQFNAFIINLNYFDLKRVIIIRPNAKDGIQGTMDNLVLDFTLPKFINFLIEKSLRDSTFNS